MDKVTGVLEVGLNDTDEIVINHGDLKPDANGVGHIVFSANQARNLAELLLKKANESETNTRRKQEEIRYKQAAEIPVDRNARVLTNGKLEFEMPDYREIQPGGQQKAYVVLSPEERAKGFIRPVRRSYQHNKCKAVTTMSRDLAETYARDPKFYSGTYCSMCANHFDVSQFVWAGTTEQVGS